MAKEMEVKVPDIGDYTDVPVIEVLVKVGDAVEKDAPLVTLESDKATLDVPSPEAGTVKSIALKAGDKVSMGAAVLVLEVGGEEAAKAEAEPAKEKPEKAEAAEPAPAEEKPDSKPVAAPETKAKAEPAEKEKKKPVAKAASVEVTVPDIGDYSDVPVIEVLVKDGDAVEKDATLLTLESDKATLDVPAPSAGVISGFKIKVGDKVSKGVAVCVLTTDSAEAESDGASDENVKEAKDSEDSKADDAKPVPEKSEKTSEDETEAAKTVPAAAKTEDSSPKKSETAPATDSDAIPYASPSIRKFARELGVDLLKVSGSGPKGRITLEDVQGHVKKALATPPATAAMAGAGGSGIPPIPAVDFSQFGKIEIKPLARIRKLSAAHLHRSWLNVPHVTQTDEADITELEAFRKAASDESAASGGPKLTLLPFMMKAVAKAIAAYPEFASSLSSDGESLIYKHYLHIGFAADTPNGLVVPVVRDVAGKGIVQLAAETAELAKKARDGKLKADDMKGGVFSISSLGGIGGSHFTPIVNAPEVGILGVSRSTTKPVWDGSAFQPRLMVPLSLSYDHRVIDGAYAARFIVLLVKLLSDLRRLSL